MLQKRTQISVLLGHCVLCASLYFLISQTQKPLWGNSIVLLSACIFLPLCVCVCSLWRGRANKHTHTCAAFLGGKPECNLCFLFTSISGSSLIPFMWDCSLTKGQRTTGGVRPPNLNKTYCTLTVAWHASNMEPLTLGGGKLGNGCRLLPEWTTPSGGLILSFNRKMFKLKWVQHKGVYEHKRWNNRKRDKCCTFRIHVLLQ